MKKFLIRIAIISVLITCCDFIIPYLIKAKMPRSFHMPTVQPVSTKPIESVEEPISLEASGEEDIPPFLQGCAAGNIRMLKDLIKKGVNPSLKNSEGNTALHYAATSGNNDLIRGWHS